ncbi:GH3 auxin-responsive promoter family protein [Trichocoleus sp. ST-U2]|uniref:GH3 family domain-containing protein n=2 Tax=Cyanobacteriota TaxID=1117 RepID=UPI0018EFB8EC|nr:GH3 auxin-responsive promoter family protein [Coleofasciculus sp. FACHB-SPT9]
MMRPIVKLFGQLLSPYANHFFQALENPERTQQSVQEEIVDNLAKSEYGKFLGIRSVADWHRIPIVNYDDLKEWIERQKTTQQPILTPESILFYEKTSGSSGSAKSIPYTKSLRATFNQMFCVWAHDLIQHGPGFSTGKIYFCISPRLDTASPNSIPVALEDDSEYLDEWLMLFLRPFLVSPPGLNRLRNAEEFKEKLAHALLLEENLEVISIWSPSFLRVQLDYIQTHRVRLWKELKNKMSAKRSKLLLEPEIPWKLLWQELKLISCWDSANAADGAGFLRSLFPGVMVQGKGLLATEAPMTIPLIQAQGCVPMLDQVFFEFEDGEGKIHRLHEIVAGINYEIIISQKGGLYRYRIGDCVRVSHFYQGTPCLEFLGRNQATSDLVGEKLHSEFVRSVIEDLALEKTFFKSLVPVRKPVDRYILLLDTAKESPDAIAQRLDDALMRSHHYRQARLLGQLAPARVLVSRQIPEIITLYGMRAGKKWGDLKHPLLAIAPLEEELLVELEKASQNSCFR